MPPTAWRPFPFDPVRHALPPPGYPYHHGAYYATPLAVTSHAPYGFPFAGVAPPTGGADVGHVPGSGTRKDDPHAPTINGVVEQITQELKNILKKDFNKKMVEMTAFKKFEAW